VKKKYLCLDDQGAIHPTTTIHKKMETYKAIIFDLGGVILNLNYQLTEYAFIQLGMADFKTIYSQHNQKQLFDDFETGKVSQFHFINRMLDLLPKGCNGNQVVHAWNAMILDFPTET
jgi:glucose-1-phosphatase